MSYYEEEASNKSGIKVAVGIGAVVVGLVVALVLGFNFFHSNNVQNFQVVQSLNGNVEIRAEGGFYCRFFPRIWTYPKVNTVFFSNEKKESKDQDGVQVRFSNKGEGDVSCQVVYRLYTDQESIKRLHTYSGGSIDVIDNLVLSKLKDIAMTCASNITSSQAIENREEFAERIRKHFVNNKELKDAGIIVEQFSITKINFDRITTDLFQAQQRADLQKKTAEAEKQNLQMQKERTVAQYEQQVAESKGRAEVEKIKAVTDAQRQKELAEIKAQQEVVVAELAKKQASVEAEKQLAVAEIAKKQAAVEAEKKLEVAEIQRKEEAAKLEVIKIQSDQKVAAAKARQQEIQLSGAMAENERIKLEIEKETKIGVAHAWAQGLSQMKLPNTLMIGGADGKSSTPIDTLVNLMVVEKANQVNKQK